MSSGLSVVWRAFICAPHRPFACVQSTPFGRDVVPDVYWILLTASGSASSSGAPFSSPRRSSNAIASALRGVSGVAPTSVSVTAIHLRFGPAFLTIDSNLGWVTATLAAQSSRKYCISSSLERVLVVTTMAPSREQACHVSKNSGQFSMCSSTTSPLLTPSAFMPAATRQTSR